MVHLTYADEDHRLFKAKQVYSEQTEGFITTVEYKYTTQIGKMMRKENS